jgi:hypothetical protein
LRSLFTLLLIPFLKNKKRLGRLGRAKRETQQNLLIVGLRNETQPASASTLICWVEIIKIGSVGCASRYSNEPIILA